MLDSLPYASYLLSGFIGLGLAAASGFRVFLPLFFVSLGAYLGWIPLSSSMEWLSGLPTLIATGLAMIFEILAYYLPFIDNLLDTVSIPLATIAGSLMFASQFTDLGTFPLWALALIAGGGTAATISSGFAGTRVASSASTGGIGNSAVASTETVGAGLLTFLSIAAPVIAGILAIGLLIFVWVMGRKLWNRFMIRKSPSTGKTIVVDTVEKKELPE